MALVVGRGERLGTAVRVLRAVLFAVVLLGGMAGVQYQMAKDTSLTRLHEDLRERRVEAIDYRYEVDGDGRYQLDVHWSTGPFSWWEFNQGGGIHVPREILEAFPEDYDDPIDPRTFERDLRAAVGDQDVDIRVVSNEWFRPANDFGEWVLKARTPFGWPALLFTAACLAMFGVMLARGGHRYANRWAWAWLFLSGPLGVLAYLLLERRPFPPELPPRARPPIGGFTGFLISIPAALAFSFAAAGLGYVLI